MNLQESIDAYVDWRRAHGAKFVTGAESLHLFCKRVGGDIDCNAARELMFSPSLPATGR